MFGWLRRRVAEPDPVPRDERSTAAARFDASIDFDPAVLGVPAERVRAEVGAVPGAGWVSVEPHAGATLEVRLFEAGSGFEAAGAAWEAMRREIERVIRRLGDGAEWAPAPGPPVRMGFAESATQFEALEQLAQLASKLQEPERKRRDDVAPPPAPPPIAAPAMPAEAQDDVFRLSRLLALVLPVDPKEQAQAAVRRFGSFAAVLAAPPVELRRVPGLGTHCVAAIKLIHAAAIRHARAGIVGQPVLADPKRLADYLSAALARERIEQFRILFLDADGMLRADEVQAQGTVNHTPVYPREVVRRALALGASSVILVHNHPSGDPAPSREDIEMTRQVQQAASVLQIGLRDHVIIGNGRWLSFRDEGLLA